MPGRATVAAPRPRLEGYWMRVQGPAHRPWMQSFISAMEWTHRLKVQLYQQIETCHPESQDCTLNREMKETKLKAQSIKTQWFENEREGGEAGAGGLAAPVLISIRPPLIKSP